MDIKVVIGQMIVLFALMGLGFLLYRVNILDLNTNSKLTSLVLSVTTPCMVLNSVLCTEKYSDSKTIFTILGIAVVTYVITPFIGVLINKLLHVQKNQTGLYVFMTVFSNIGFISILTNFSVCSAAKPIKFLGSSIESNLALSNLK